jgi:hypothetical protein
MQHSVELTPCYAESPWIRELLREIETKIENILGRSSVTLGALIDEKSRGSKISWHYPFDNEIVHRFWNILQFLSSLHFNK